MYIQRDLKEYKCEYKKNKKNKIVYTVRFVWEIVAEKNIYQYKSRSVPLLQVDFKTGTDLVL